MTDVENAVRGVIETAQAPAALGPYSQAIRIGDMVFCSGQIPLDPRSGELVGGEITEQARRVLDNLRAILGAAGLTMGEVVRTTIFLVDLGDFAALNAVYAAYFTSPFPARSTVQVAALPRGARVEIDAIACASAGMRIRRP